ncbi:MAG: alpha/beta fold hydrolase [Nitrospirota bacterium]|nr:alpha/beta fold hydrolase [Nitrospirota bacterium]
MISIFIILFLLLLLFKVVAHVPRWIEISNRPEYIHPEGIVPWLAQLAPGALPVLADALSTVVIFFIWMGETPYRWLQRQLGSLLVVRPGDGTPVVLVHGFFLTPFSMVYLWLRLRAHPAFWGRPLYLLDYHPSLAGIDHFVTQLDALLTGVSPSRQVDIVAHSMGGLIAARYIGFHPGRVRRLVTVGTPFAGTRTWALSTGQSLAQMRPGSEFLRETTGHPEFPGATAVTSIYSRFDHVVLPFDSSRLSHAGVTNIELQGIDHGALLFHPRVAERVVQALEPA